MEGIEHFNEDRATIGNGGGRGSAQNVREYPVARPMYVNPTDEIQRERIPALFYVSTLYPHFYADSMATTRAEADRNLQEASAPYRGCHFPQPFSPGRLLPTIVPAVEPRAYMQQHYGGDHNISTCWLPPDIPMEGCQGSSSSRECSRGTQTTTFPRQRPGLKELALLPGCDVSDANDESGREHYHNQEHDQDQDQSSAIAEDVVCTGARSGAGRPEARRPAARARRGGSGFQSAQNLSLALFQPHPAVAHVPLVIPDLVKLRVPKKEKEIVDSGLINSPNEARNLTSASSRHRDPTGIASPAHSLTAPNVRGQSPPKSNDRIIQIPGNLSVGEGAPQQTALKDFRFMKPIMDILQEVCHLTMIQQTRKRPGHPPVRQLGVRLSVEGEVVEPADPRLGSIHAAPPGNLPAHSRLQSVSVVEIEVEKHYLLKMLEELTNIYMLHKERLERLTKQFNTHVGEGMAELYIAVVQVAMARNFRAVRVAIARRLRVVRNALGEDIKFVFKSTSRGALVPQASNVWRPHRGLPGPAVRVLRSWLFEHFLHPYPKDKDKMELASQTGLSRSQVSNWFINARVRLWKPMVEEMYKEELIREEAAACEQETRVEAEKEASAEPIAKLLDKNRDEACIEAVENHDHILKDDHSGQADNGPQHHRVQVGVNELGLIHVYGAEESSSSRQPDDELEAFLTMPEEFARVDKRLRPAMPLKICKLEPKDT